MATKMYCAKGLVTGADGMLDAIDYADLSDQDMALTVILTGAAAVFYVHAFDASSALDESSPKVIAPDDVATNTGRWILVALSLQDGSMPPDDFGSDLGDGTHHFDKVFTRYVGRYDDGVKFLFNSAPDYVSLNTTLRPASDEDGALGTSAQRWTSVNLSTHLGDVGAGRFFSFDTAGEITFRPSLLPTVDDSYDLGDITHRLDDIFATNGTINTSGKEKKKQIAETKLGLDFVMVLTPKEFVWEDTLIPARLDEEGNELEAAYVKTHKRKHQGLIAQDVEKVLEDQGVDTNDFAGFVKDGENHGLRYHEFIAPIIKAIQELSIKNDTLEARIAALEK